MTDCTEIDVSIIVVSYNTREMTLNALRSVARQTTGVSYELLVVDNDSSDNSAAAIADEFPDARVNALSKNIGFAAANNLAAIKARGRYVLLLNPDTVVKNSAIDNLVAFSRKNPHAKIWGGRTLFGDGSLNPSSCWHRMSLWNTFCRAAGLTGLFASSEFFNAETFGAWPRDTERRVDIVSGCFFLIERTFWTKLGGFDPTFFMYGEEADLCIRAKEFGANPMVTPAATIVHYGGASETTQSGKLVKLLSAKATLINRHFPDRQKHIGLGLLMAWPLSRWFAFRLIATLTQKTNHKTRAKIWKSVWQQRDTWQNGWPLAATRAGAQPQPIYAQADARSLIS